jgi:hypothetical protein
MMTKLGIVNALSTSFSCFSGRSTWWRREEEEDFVDDCQSGSRHEAVAAVVPFQAAAKAKKARPKLVTAHVNFKASWCGLCGC